MTKPYYEDECVTLYHGDCREVTDWLTADVLVTDPPYGQDYRSNFAGAASKLARSIANDADTSVRDSMLALWGDKPRIVFEGRDVPPIAPRVARLIWHKPGAGMGDLSVPWQPDYEFISVNGTGFTGHRGSSVLTNPLRVFRGVQLHPHTKPDGLMESLIAKTPPGVIADPFAGSGSTLVAARNLGRKVIGVELEEKYCELIVSRLSQQAFDFTALEPSSPELRSSGWPQHDTEDGLFKEWAP